jgi:hypothetical protein
LSIWQSIAMVSPWQVLYAIGLVILFWWRGVSAAAVVLLIDFAALLAILAAMDFGWLDRDAATSAMMVIWCGSTVSLAILPGAAKIMAILGLFGVAAFIATIAFGVQIGTTSAIVNMIGFVMLAVAIYGLGNGSGFGGGGDRGVSGDPVFMAPKAGNQIMGAGGLATRADLLSQDRGGR